MQAIPRSLLAWLTQARRAFTLPLLALSLSGVLALSACGGTPSSNSGSTVPATATITPGGSHGGPNVAPTPTPPQPTPNPSQPTPTLPPQPTPAPTPHPNFIQVANGTNSAGDYTVISNSLTNDNPNALLFVTPNWNPGGNGGVYDNSPIGVFYFTSGATGYWAIFNQNLSGIPSGASFNVQVLSASSTAFVQTANGSNIFGDNTVINNAALNNNPGALLMVTANWNPGDGGSDVYDNHPIGVYYNGSNWAIFNQDAASMPSGASFNVHILSSGASSFVQTANSSNIAGDYTTINAALANGQPNAIVLATPNWNPNNDGADVYLNHNIGVWYTGSGWAIFDQDAASMTFNASFNVEILSAS